MLPAVLIVAAAAGIMYARAVLLGSMPTESGVIRVAGLGAAVRIERDRLGIPTLSGRDFEDVCQAEGFVHAQERFAQMDGLRRYASGRLAEVFGASMLERDKLMRPHGFERLADEVLKKLPESHRLALRAYARGVNQGLASLASPPPEYALLRVSPVLWQDRDSLLVQYAMWDLLALGAGFEKMVHVMRGSLPLPLVEFLTPPVTRFDAPLLGPPPSAADIPQLPSAESLNVGVANESMGTAGAGMASDRTSDDPMIRWFNTEDLVSAGSNSMAIAGNRSRTGSAILGNDMHLPLRVPAVWYRVSLRWTHGRLDGLSLPGVPGIVAGSNGSIAWGCTNVEGDFEDWIIIETDPADPDRYRTPEGGTEEFGRLVEQFEVRGGQSQRAEYRTTRWGPVSMTDFKGRALVARWIAQDSDRTNINIFNLFAARTIEEGVAAAASWYGPPQNVLLASSTGRIAWVVSGSIPKRTGFDGSYPVSWANKGVGWSGWLDEKDRPKVIDPPGGVLYTANQRTVAPAQALLLGRGWANPSRAARLADLLTPPSAGPFDEATVHRIQLDTRRAQMDFYRDLAVAAADAAPQDLELAGCRRVLAGWNGTADADQNAFALLKIFRNHLRSRILDWLTEPCIKADKSFRYRWFNEEEPIRQILEARPPHLLPPGHDNWEGFIRSALLDSVKTLGETGPKKGLETTWGEINRAKIEHPVASALAWIPGLSERINMPRDPLPGDGLSVRVQTAEFGASQRLAVSPGHEESGICVLPCGQSGHPLSPHYRDLHADWVNGHATPLLPGTAVTILTLEPEGK